MLSTEAKPPPPTLPVQYFQIMVEEIIEEGADGPSSTSAFAYVNS
jgi:hypothetical protein